MSKEDLIPTDISKRPDFLELSAKGGRAKSKAKTIANTIKGLKTASPEKLNEHITKLIIDQDYSAKDLTEYIEAIKNLKLADKDRIAYGKLLIERQKTLHGEKRKVEHSGQVRLEGSIFDKFKKLKQNNGGDKV